MLHVHAAIAPDTQADTYITSLIYYYPLHEACDVATRRLDDVARTYML